MRTKIGSLLILLFIASLANAQVAINTTGANPDNSAMLADEILMAMSISDEATDSNTRLLIIDDDKKLCRLIGDYLQPLGYYVETVHTGPEGVEKATQLLNASVFDC